MKNKKKWKKLYYHIRNLWGFKAMLYRHLMTVKNPIAVSDGRGGHTTEEIEDGTVYAAIIPLNAYELAKYKSVLPEVSCKLQTRFTSKITNETVLYYGTRRFEIIGVLNPLERNIKLELLAKETPDKN